MSSSPPWTSTSRACRATCASCKSAGFVTVRPEGAQRFYSLRAEPFRELDAWVGQYRKLWEARLDRFAQQLERKQKARAAKRKETAS